MLIWEGPGTNPKPAVYGKDWRNLRRVRDQIALIRLEMAALAWTSQAKAAEAANREREPEQHLRI